MPWISPFLLIALASPRAEKAQECTITRIADGKATVTRTSDPALWRPYFNPPYPGHHQGHARGVASASSSVSATAADGGRISTPATSAAYTDETGALVTSSRDDRHCAVLITEPVRDRRDGHSR